MAYWERDCYAAPGDLVSWPYSHKLSRPFFYNPPSKIMLDDRDVEEVTTVKMNTQMLVVACFPEGRDDRSPARGAILLVPDRGLWWWRWP